MKVAALYDIHANTPALEAVLDEVHAIGVDLIVFGGDVLPGPLPRETLRLLRSLRVATRFISGNGERVVLMASRGEEPIEVPARFRETIYWNAKQLNHEDLDWISSWPATLSVAISNSEVLFCHATPRNDTDIFTEQTEESVLLPILERVSEKTIVCGHTHMQFDRRVGQKRVVNSGSVGMSFEGPGAYWLLIGDEIRLCRTSYDVARAADQIRASGYPIAEEFAAQNVLTTPTKEAMLKAFGNVRLS
jgi:Icc-related predicted phosphoesterase